METDGAQGGSAGDGGRAHVSRRGFLAALGGALTLGFNVGCGGAAARMIRHADQTGELAPNAFVSVKRDGRVALALHKAEFGQGVATAYTTLVAEELDVPIEAVDFTLADPHPDYNTNFLMQLTGGSTSAKEGYLPMRRAAAAAREMLVGAAAAAWGVAPSECRTDSGQVVHDRTSRRAGYGELTVKAARLPVPSEPKLKARSEFKHIGKRNHRVDARAKVDGSARFGMDVVVPGMARALVLHGPVYGAQAKAVRADGAKRMPGVVAVVAIRGGVAVVAEKYWQALAAAPHVEVEWTAGDVAGFDTAELRAQTRAYKKKGGAVRADGDADGAFAEAKIKVEAVYETPYLAHATMEPQNCTVAVRGEAVEVWAPCQSPTLVQAYVADALGVSPSDVLVHSTFVGGGFGRRIVADWAAQAAEVARAVGRPVQMIWSRESDMTQAFYRPQGTAHLRGAVSADGSKVGALSAHLVSQSIALDMDMMVAGMTAGVPKAVQRVFAGTLAAIVGSNTFPDLFALEGIADTAYAIENLSATFTPVQSKLPISSWRSVGNSVTGFVAEGFVDELARAAKKDPYLFRRAMLPAGSRALPVLDAVAKLAKWGERRQGVGRGIARHFCFDTEVAEVADVEIIDGRIKVRRVWAVVDCGLAINPDIVRAQVEGAIIFGLSAALDQEITMVRGVVQQTNFDRFPLLRMHECPEIVVQIMESERDPTGIGEPGLPPIAPAVANAVFDLTGHRLRRLPLQPAFDEARRT